MKVVVTGREGQLARALGACVRNHPGIELVALGRPQLDLEQPAAVAHILAEAKPDIVVNAAAYTAVDRAEAESALAYAVNRDGARAVAEAAWHLGVPLIHISTDYVYGGDKPDPYVESDPTAPLGVYGRSKLAGEQAVRSVHPGALILRTSWVYSPYGQNFVKTMLRLGGERDELRVVDDQTGNPTSALDLADAIFKIAPELLRHRSTPLTLHLAGEGSVSWFGLAAHVFALAAASGQRIPKLVPIPSASYPTPARRPVNSRLDCTRFQARFGLSLPHWEASVDETVSLLL